MQSVSKKSNKSIDEYRHNIKLLKYHLKKEQKINETLRYKDSKKNKKQSIIKQSKNTQKHHLYAMLDTVGSLNSKIKQIGLSLGDIFRMADGGYKGEITKEQFMATISKIKANLQENQINQMFYAIDSNLNGMLSSDEYEEFLDAHGGTQTKSALTFQKDTSQKFMALLKKKNMRAQDFVKKLLNPMPLDDMNGQLKKMGLNVNQIMILFKMWDPSLTGFIKQQVFLKSMQNVKQKDERQIQNQKYQKGIKQLCVIFRDRKINPIQIFQSADADGTEGVSVFELQQGFKKIMPQETSYQIKKWINLINIDNNSEITKQQFVSAIRSFYSLQKIQTFSNQYEKLHPKLKKALAEEQIPAQKIINQLSIIIEDNGFTKTQVFHRIDINHNGLVDKSELFDGLKGLGINIGFIGKVLAVFDRDASGEIGLEEWLSILGEDLEMEDVPEEESAVGEKTAMKDKKEHGKNDKPTGKTKQTKKQTKKESPTKQDSKMKETSKSKQSSIKESVKRPITDKSSKKTEEVKPKPIAKKQEQKKPLKDQDKNKAITNKASQKAPVKQSKKQIPITKKSSKAEEESFKRFADEQMEDLKQTFSQEQVNTEQLQHEIAQNYAKSPKKIKDIFSKCSKNNKKGLNQRQLTQFIRQLKLKTEYDDKMVKKIFEDNCSGNGLITTEWFQKIAQTYDLQPKEQPKEEQPPMKDSKAKKNDNMITIKNNAITSKIPKVLEEKVEHEEDYGNEQFDQHQAEQNEESNAKRAQNNENQPEHRGASNENFQELVQNHTLENQTISNQGYKLKNYISCDEELSLLEGKYKTTANSIKKNKKIYQDKSFPSNLSSLTHLPPNESQISNVTLLKWKHYKQIYKNAQLFKDSISPNDIKQGTLGDCYFLCSLAALAEYKNLIQRLFEYFDIDNGYFLVWVCIDGSWRLIELDGYIPVNPSGDRPAFSHGQDEELWVMLLQKAYAKAYGNYEKINGGQPYEAIKDLTGAPGQSFCHTKQDIKIEDIWKKLQSANKEQFMMTCGTDTDQSGTITMDGHSESVTNEGLVLGHAYSILDVRQYKGQKLIQLRNPWGETEWKGDWSDQSKKWTQQAKKQLNYSALAEDGIFWMPFEAFFQKYNTTAINYIRPSYYYASEMHKGAKSLVLKISEGSLRHGFVMATQSDHRKQGLPPNTPYNMCQIITLQYKKGKILREISNQKYLYQRQGSAQITTNGDTEIIVLINLQRKTDVNICTYSDSKFTFEIDEKTDGMMKYIDDLAMMQGRAKNAQETPNMFKCWMSSVGEYAFQVFKSVAKKNLQFSVQLSAPKNLELLEKNNKITMKLAPGETKCIRGRIANLKDSYSFGPMQFSIDQI